jgi:hypothetical protein
VHAAGSGRRLADIKSGRENPAVILKGSETVFEVELMPVFYKVFKLV